jgi:cystathionine beta-lyase/cystathionine gamma-synthase
LRKAAAFAKKHNLVSVVDNTFATPMLQNPIELGFDLVVHSVTKGLAGHSDLLGGVVAGSSKHIASVRKMVTYFGGVMDPEVAFLLMRGIKTLGVRLERQCDTAMRLAKFLEKHPKVAKVHYPGLKSHPSHSLAKRQMRGFGSMLAFDLKGGLAAAHRFVDRVRVFLLAASLGGVESLIILPVYGSHYHMSREEQQHAGVQPGTVRVSVGLEDPEDLLDDLKQALA